MHFVESPLPRPPLATVERRCARQAVVGSLSNLPDLRKRTIQRAVWWETRDYLVGISGELDVDVNRGMEVEDSI